MKQKLRLFITVILIMSFMKCGIYADNSILYKDLNVKDKDHWAKPYIESLSNIGVFNGYSDGVFKPDDNIRVDEFIKVVVLGMGYKIENGKDYWAGPYLEQAERIGLTQEGEFPKLIVNYYSKPITRGQMARIIARAVAINETISTDYAKYSLNLIDYIDIKADYQDYVLKAFSSGIITGRPDGTFGAKDSATRAEAATMISRLINKDQRILPKEITKYSPEAKLNAFAVKYPDNIVLEGEGYTIHYWYEGKPDYDVAKFFLIFDRFDYYFRGDIEYQIVTLDAYTNENNKAALKDALKILFPTSYEDAYKVYLETQKKTYDENANDTVKTYEGRRVQFRKLIGGAMVLVFKAK
jgi:hypothetical protein